MLREILIKEDDFEFINRLFIEVGMMTIEDKAKVFTMDQYRGSKFHIEIESGINKNLLSGIKRMRIWDVVIISVDAHKLYYTMKNTIVYWCSMYG